VKILLSITIRVLSLLAMALVAGANASVTAQQDVAAYLEARFKELNVPVVSVRIVQEDPLEVELTLLSEGRSGGPGTANDVRNSYQVDRELRLAGRQGYAIDRFTLIKRDAEGQEWRSRFGSVSPIFNQVESTATSFSDAATADLIRSRIDAGALSLTSIEITSSEGPQNAVLQLVAPSLEAANREVPAVWPSLVREIDRLNMEGARILILRVELRDSTGALLIDYVRDDEIGSSRAWLAPGMNIEGIAYPPPAPDQAAP
jgi:hypothetical protein